MSENHTPDRCRNTEARTPWRICILRALHRGPCNFAGGKVCRALAGEVGDEEMRAAVRKAVGE